MSHSTELSRKDTMPGNKDDSRPHVVIVGGGFAGLEVHTHSRVAEVAPDHVKIVATPADGATPVESLIPTDASCGRPASKQIRWAQQLLLILIQWAWYYITFNRSARIIVEDDT